MIFVIFLCKFELFCSGDGCQAEEINTRHEGESKEKTEGAPKLCEEGGPGVDQLLLLHQDEGGGVPKYQIPTIIRRKLQGKLYTDKAESLKAIRLTDYRR